jgi:hypothetical protein
VDPVSLAEVLKGTGPLRLSDGTQLTSDNAVRLLLNQVYFQIRDPQQQNAYFNEVARQVFSAFTSGKGQADTVLHGLVDATQQGRLMVWSDRPAEERIVTGTSIAGALPTSTAAPQVGVYLNDTSASKMGYYLAYSTDVTATRCQAGRQYLTVTVHLRSLLQPTGVAVLPGYVRSHARGIPRGAVRVTVYGYAPAGGYFLGATYDGSAQQLRPVTQDGRQVLHATFQIAPKQQRELVYTMVSGRGQTGAPQLDTTPGAHGDGVGAVSSAAACS